MDVDEIHRPGERRDLVDDPQLNVRRPGLPVRDDNGMLRTSLRLLSFHLISQLDPASQPVNRTPARRWAAGWQALVAAAELSACARGYRRPRPPAIDLASAGAFITAAFHAPRAVDRPAGRKLGTSLDEMQHRLAGREAGRAPVSGRNPMCDEVPTQASAATARGGERPRARASRSDISAFRRPMLRLPGAALGWRCEPDLVNAGSGRW
jgi:hypothetical protein